MKKLFILVLVAFSLTACGSNTKVVCTGTSDETITLSADKNKKVVSMVVATQADVSKEEYDASKVEMEAFMAEMSKTDGLTMSASHKGDTATMTLELDFKKMSKEDLSSMGYGSQFGSDFALDEAVTSFESQGYKCK